MIYSLFCNNLFQGILLPGICPIFFYIIGCNKEFFSRISGVYLLTCKIFILEVNKIVVLQLVKAINHQVIECSHLAVSVIVNGNMEMYNSL